MPMTIENAVVAKAARRLHSICGRIRLISEFLAAAFLWCCKRRLAASFWSCSRCFFLFQNWRSSFYEGKIRKKKFLWNDGKSKLTLPPPFFVHRSQFHLADSFHTVQLLLLINTRMVNPPGAKRIDHFNSLHLFCVFRKIFVVVFLTWDKRQCKLAISQSSLKMSFSRYKTIATVTYNGIRNGDAKK